MLKKFVDQLNKLLWRQAPGWYLEPLLQRFWPAFMAGFYQAKIICLTSEAGCLRIRLRVSRRFPRFIPGQHVQLRIQLDGRFVERTFSLCSDVADLAYGELELAIKPQHGGVLTNRLGSLLKPGMSLHLSQPAGAFGYEPRYPAVMLAAGSGITPLFSMLVSARRLLRPVTLIYCYRGPTAPLFAKELQLLANSCGLLELVFQDSSAGRFDFGQWLAQRPQSADTVFYLCGPATAMQQWQQQLRQAGYGQRQIRQEAFGLQAATGSAATVAVISAGQRIYLSGQGLLLQRAEQSGVTAPYGCRRGVCLQCLCWKHSGVVRNVSTGELSSAGPEFIQLCNTEAISPVELTLTSDTQ
jgi:ferredoxin-NADP reductase